MKKKRYALISVSNKKNIGKICKLLKKYNIVIISSGNTFKYIKKIGFTCNSVSQITNFPELLDGRVKTLNPLIHASLLFDRKNRRHIKEFNKLNFPIIDFVIVNFYPLNTNRTLENNTHMDFVDIGGPSLLRSAAKNYNFITAISTPDDYIKLEQNIKKFSGKTSLQFRKEMAQKVFTITSEYDHKISEQINYKKDKNNNFSKFKNNYLSYGENPHQKAFYSQKNNSTSLFNNKNIIQGKKLSFNNMLDVDSAYNCLSEFLETS